MGEMFQNFVSDDNFLIPAALPSGSQWKNSNNKWVPENWEGKRFGLCDWSVSLNKHVF